MAFKDSDKVKRQSYMRLLRYVAPYKFRLAIGILAGFIVGGSLFASFLMIPQLMKGVQSDQQVTGAEKRLQDIQEISNDATLSTKDRQNKIDTLCTVEKKDVFAEKFNKAQEWAEWAGVSLPATYDKSKKELSLFSDSIIIPTEVNGKMTYQLFSLVVIGFILVWTLKNLATYINRYFTRWVGTKIVADLRNEVFTKLMSQSLRFYGKIDMGQLIARCTNDTAAIESAVANTIANATRCPIEILACAGGIIFASYLYNDYALPIILFAGIPISVLPIIIVGRKVRKMYRRAYGRIATVVSRMHEVFTGMIIVKAYHTEKKEEKIFRDVNRKYFRSVIQALKPELMMNPLMETVAVAATLVFLIYSYSRGVTLDQLAMLLTPAFMAYQPIKKLAKVNTYIQRSMAAADRYFELLDADTALIEKDNPTRISSFEKEIKLNDVVFSYEGKTNILDHTTVTIPKGHVVAVVGETGSGKTTIANLIARFYDVNDGSVTIDGHDVRDLKISDLRNLIGIVTQDPNLFNDTIANNIAYGCENATKEEIIVASKQANAHQFIINGQHAEGYDTVVGEKGCKLSGGEKQRVSIARAILKNPSILILDEATSALDTVTEKLVQDALNHAMENRTVFAIAHRLSTIKHANTIIVLDKGKVIESGTHDELLEQGGRYKKLYKTQFGITEEDTV